MDIIDGIQENCNGELKHKRVLSAKEIFNNGLQIDVLQIILKNEDQVANQQMLERAQLILKEEQRA